MKQELLLGCGAQIVKQMKLRDDTEGFDCVTTLDINPDRKPDIVWDLNNLPMPFADSIYDEVHAYHVLEHLGRQGDIKAFFGIFEDIWRVLKPNGRLYAVVPYWNGDWVWGDPGHTRMIHPNSLGFLQQKFYNNIEQTITSDYRYIYKGDFEILEVKYTDDKDTGIFAFVLKALK